MAPAEDSTAHWDYCIPPSDDIYPLSPFFFFPNHPTSANTTSRDLSGHQFGMSSVAGSSALLHGQSVDENSYDKYSASGYASSSANGPTRRHQSPPLPSWSLPSADGSAMRFCTPSNNFRENLDSFGLSGHVETKSQRYSCSPAPQSTLTGNLPPARSARDYLDHNGPVYLSPDPSESLLSPLPLSWPGKRLSLGALPGDMYNPGLMFSGALGSINGSKDSPIPESDEDDFSSNHPFPQLLWGSPSSVDTDLDDESITSSTSSLSPEYLDTDLRHSPLGSEEDEEFEDDPYYCQLSPPMRHDDHRYHIDQYPMRFDLYDETLSPLSLSSPHQQRLSPESPLLQPASPPLPNPDSLGFPLLSFPKNEQWSLYNTEDASIHVPSSPSRRRSADLPLLDEDPFGLQEGSSSMQVDDAMTTTPDEPPQRNFWLSLPGAETDDDLIPRELGSKNYVPDPTITVPTTPPSSSSSGGLLLWDVDGGDLVRRRSPSPEDFYLDPTVLAELPKDATGAEVAKIYELKQRTAGRESWEREKSRELSALLRLKLRLDETGAPSAIGACSAKPNAVHSGLQAAAADAAGRVSHPTSISAGTTSTAPVASGSSPSEPASTSTPPPDLSSMSTPNPNAASTRSSHPFRSTHSSTRKPAISSMDQLVANMVFHRQQEPLRKKPSRARTWSPPAAGVPKAHPTPKSPLRQVLLPDECDDEDEEMDEGEGLSPGLAQLVESPLPLSPLCLMETDLAPPLTYQ